MTDHLRRIREHMALEMRALQLEADRARLLDSTTNRGSEAEHSIRRWLSARFAPGYAMSSGEVIDSFDTTAGLKSRQQDGILHANSSDANRFLLPSGQRLLPIETVAAVVEVKLTLTKEEFDRANIAAEETSRLRLRADPRRSALPTLPGETHGKNVDGVRTLAPHITDEQYESGVPLSEERFGRSPTTFALFAFGGIQDIATIRNWMEGATISLVCCLSAGCTVRNGAMKVGRNEVSSPGAPVEADAGDALWHFSETLVLAMQHHTRVMNSFQADFDAYAPYGKSLVVQSTVIDEPVVPGSSP